MGTYLVTGGAGFIGSHLVDALLERGHRVRVLDDLSSGKLENLPAALLGRPGEGTAVEFFQGSITDADLCLGACSGVEGVFHEAAQVSVPRSVEDPRTSYAINVTGTLNVLEAARLQGVTRVVFAASSAAYGDSATLPKEESMLPQPLSPYASGKVAGEHLLRVYAHAFGLKTVALRYFNIFGPRQADDSPYTGVIALFAKALLTGQRAMIFGDGEQTRDFTFIENVVDANLRAMERDIEPGAVINIGGGARVSINALHRRMAQLLGRNLEPVHRPARAGDVRDSLASLDRARALLGYEPKATWEYGLERTVAWYRDRAVSPVAM
ncbi:MAG: SDR family oxidoreductase [Planctomycetes bacterium]|nr:SDR family oxidoreductase [Planctomycetota bacterium]